MEDAEAKLVALVFRLCIAKDARLIVITDRRAPLTLDRHVEPRVFTRISALSYQRSQRTR